MVKVLITGGDGNLARELNKTSKNKIIFSPSKDDMDIRDKESVEDVINKFSPDYIIHAAAFTKPMNDHQLYPDKSIETNIVGTSNIVLSCLKKNIKLIYISTDYVYPGLSGNYSENDPLLPFSVVNDGVSKYGWSKLGGECAVRILENSLIIRACICEFPFPHPKALLDVRKSLMYIRDAAPIIWRLIDEKGIINLGGIPQSVFEFASKDNPKIFSIKSREIKDVKIAPDTTMNTQKLQRFLNERN